jgi:hypothetical protein
VTWDRTPREAVADALDTLRRCHVTSIGIVINRAQGGEQGWLRAGPARETGRAFAAGPAAAGRPAWQSGTAPDAKAGSDPKWM